MSLLTIRNLRKYFPLKYSRSVVKALDDVSLELPENTTLAIVGESGSGKTTLGRCVLSFVHVTGGSIKFRGEEITQKPEKEFRPFRKKIQVVFQNPHNALNPRMRISKIIREPYENWLTKKNGIADRVTNTLNVVGLDSSILNRYPHQLSGGQLQRIALALAIANEPDLIVLDEPTSSLDVMATAKLIDLLVDIKHRLKTSYIFISHDLHAVEDISDIVAVMYLGRIVELGWKDDIFREANHPYTRALLASMLGIDQEQNRKIQEVSGEIPSPIDLPTGCYFYSRCPHRMERCALTYPPVAETTADHFVNCHLFENDEAN